MTFWNATGIDTVLATPLGPRGAPLGSRAMAMMHVAMADAVTSIHPRYKPYAIRIRGHRNANEIAAAASAAYGVLVRLFPARQAQLDAALAESLAQVRDGKKKDQGIALGDEVAAQIVALRANDGSSDGLPVHATRRPRVLATRSAHRGQPLPVLGGGDTLDDAQRRPVQPGSLRLPSLVTGSRRTWQS